MTPVKMGEVDLRPLTVMPAEVGFRMRSLNGLPLARD
jgi:hypothetical protein